jgi:hypothetical protein
MYIYIYIEISQGNSLFPSTKMSFFFFKNGVQEGRTCPPWGVGTNGKEEEWGKDVGG